MHAAKAGNKNVVQWLVESGGADVHAADAAGKTALMIAAEHGETYAVEYLVETAGADVHAAVGHGSTALMLAASIGHADVVQWLVETGGEDVHAADGSGTTALMWAARGSAWVTEEWDGHVGVVRWLAETGGANVAATNSDGGTALMVAASSKKVSQMGWWASQYAAFADHEGLAEYLASKEAGDGPPEERLAALKGHVRDFLHRPLSLSTAELRSMPSSGLVATALSRSGASAPSASRPAALPVWLCNTYACVLSHARCRRSWRRWALLGCGRTSVQTTGRPPWEQRLMGGEVGGWRRDRAGVRPGGEADVGLAQRRRLSAH
eukprot:311789-Rhodomonas_salina.1